MNRPDLDKMVELDFALDHLMRELALVRPESEAECQAVFNLVRLLDMSTAICQRLAQPQATLRVIYPDRRAA
jgi:hypothetical protein